MKLGLEEFMERVERGERLRPVRWNGAALLQDGWIVRSGNLFHEITPRTIGMSVSPWQVGARDHHAKWGPEWELVE